MAPPDGTELIAELPQADLDAAVAHLVPPHFVAGEDARTPNQIRVHRRPRERAAALLWELPAGTTPFDLHAQARELSRRARTIVWDSWPSLTLVEHTGSEETSQLDSGHNGSWRGVDWWSIKHGEVRAPFSEGLVQLLHDRRNQEFVCALLDDLYGFARTPVLLATYHHAFEIAAESAALAPLLSAVIARAVHAGRTEVRGLGAFVCHPGPPRTIGYIHRHEPVDLDDWSEALTAAERAAAAEALRHLIDRLVPATDLVVPGLACFGCTEVPEYRGANPRTGEPVVVPAKRLIRLTLLPPP